MAKLSAKAKAANLIAAKDAHIAQLQRLNDTLRANLAAVVEDKRSMDRQLDIVSLEAGDAKKSVAMFKQEALQAAVREAELRGYIQRTLEDDRVRESGPDAKAAPAMDQMTREMVRQNAHQSVEQAYLSQQPTQPVRSGPSSMSPGPYVANPDWNGHNWNDGSSRCFTSAPPPPRHWIER